LPSFGAERARYELRFTCEHCTYFHVEQASCMHGYPNAEHRSDRYRAPEGDGLAPEQDHEALVFCKEFELM
jgi:hypothetical protein